MSFRKLKRKVPAQPSKTESDDKRGLFRKKVQRPSTMSFLRVAGKVKEDFDKLALSHMYPTPEQETYMNGQIRRQFEEVKGKVGYFSPAALRFIGPGDRKTTLYREEECKKFIL